MSDDSDMGRVFAILWLLLLGGVVVYTWAEHGIKEALMAGGMVMIVSGAIGIMGLLFLNAER